MSGVSKLFKVSVVAVQKWLRAAAQRIDEPSVASTNTIIQVDEMWHFVNGKKQNLDLASHMWACRALGWHIGDRSDASLKRLIQKVDHERCVFVTDA